MKRLWLVTCGLWLRPSGCNARAEEAGECQIRVLGAAGADRDGEGAMFGAVWIGGAVGFVV